jgi:hypothetical protein
MHLHGHLPARELRKTMDLMSLTDQLNLEDISAESPNRSLVEEVEVLLNAADRREPLEQR